MTTIARPELIKTRLIHATLLTKGSFIMNINVQGKQLDVGTALKTYAAEKLEDINHKFFNHATQSQVTFSREGHGFYKTHISIHISKDIMVQSHATEDDPYLAFDVASGKIARQMRRYKNRLRDHHERLEREGKEFGQARDVVLAPAAEQDNGAEAGIDPVVVAEMTTAIQTLSVSEAVMRLDLSSENALLFKNAGHGRINMVYRRADGNIGWVDPH
jgi:ribosomal subunit interface protein